MKQGRWIVSCARIAVLGAATYFIVSFLYIVTRRINYPFELEWMEGGTLDHVKRVMAGQSIYTKPSLEFVPYIYNPLYYYLCAPFAFALGDGFFPPRLVSFLASGASSWAIYSLVRLETGSRRCAYLSTAAFLAAFRLCGAWFDLARVDMLFIALWLWSLFALRRAKSNKGIILAGVLGALAILSKQTALMALAPIVLHEFVWDWKRGVRFGGSLLGVCALGVLSLEAVYGRWYHYCAFFLPAATGLQRESLFGLLWGTFVLQLPVEASMGFVYFLLPAPKTNLKSKSFYFCASLGSFAAAYSSRLRAGGYDNVFIPFVAVMSILFGLGLQHWLDMCGNQNTRRGRLLEILALVFCLVQFSFLRYNPAAQIPTAEDREAGERLLQKVRSIQGDVLIPYHGYLARRAGKSGNSPGLGLHFFMLRNSPVKNAFLQEIEAALLERKYRAVIVDAGWWESGWFDRVLSQNYQRQGRIEEIGVRFFPVTGGGTRPDTLYVLKNHP